MDRLIDVVIYSDNERYLIECLKYVDRFMFSTDALFRLYVSTADCDFICISENHSDDKADFRIFLRDNTFVFNKDIVNEMIELFNRDCNIGVAGIVGSDNGNEWNSGKIVISNGDETLLVNYDKQKLDLGETIFASDAFLMDINEYEWDYSLDYNENVGNAISYYRNLKKKIEIIKSDYAYCQIDLEKNDNDTVIANVLEIGKRELENGCYKFCKDLNEHELIDKYENCKFALRRVENRFDDEDVYDFCINHKNGEITRTAITAFLKKELSMPVRAFHSISEYNPFQIACPYKAVVGRVNIITSINRNYVAPLTVMLKSLFTNNRDCAFDIYILNAELTADDEKLLREFAAQYDSDVFFIKVDAKNYENIPVNSWSVETLFRLEMLDKLPEKVDRILYLDVDLIIQQSIRDFYFADFDGNDMIACKDMGNGAKNASGLFSTAKIDKGYTYCCAGVILWNVNKLKSEGIGLATYLGVAEEYNYQLFAPDQDLINYVHAGKIKLLDELRYDCFAYGLTSSEEAKRDVAILHYAGPKPWNDVLLEASVGAWKRDAINPEVYDIWWEYVEGTPFEDFYLEKKKVFLKDWL